MIRLAKPSQSSALPKADFIEIGRLLAEALESGTPEFDELCRRFGVKKRKGYYLVRIQHALRSLPIAREDLISIGWTKLELITEHLDSENWQELMDAARRHPVPDLKRVLAGELPVQGRHVVLLNLTQGQFEVFSQAIVAHGATRKDRVITGKEEALTAALRKLIT